jgi:serine/threonine-protein kinase
MSPEQTIAHYRITAKLGAGGMGEVWRATDTKLGREVAIKVLPEAFANDADRMARFTREAQVLASLNHPNIAAIYGVEERALIMELVEGPTLAERIAQGPVPLDEALPIARQIAEALEYAHERGVVHRDLKPANVKITPEGRAKLLDFGLAKAMSPETTVRDPASSPTLTMRATMAGVILGTAGYMSPEQARGQDADKRADIWSFGVVLFEMLTGRPLFAGPTISDTLAAVLTKEPDLSQAPAKVRRLLQSCLQKDPKQRLQAIGDWRLPLEDAPERAPEAKRRLPWPAIAGALAIVAAIAFWAPWRARPAPQPLVRLDVDLGSDVSLGSARGTDVILSPDGTRMVYVSNSRLFTRRFDQAKATELAGTEGAFAPFFSPDGQWVAFFTPGQLKKVAVQGGAAISLCNASLGSGGSWGEDGNIVASPISSAGLWRLPSSGGTPTRIAEPATGEAGFRWPQILPGGKAVLFTAFTSVAEVEGANIEVMSLSDRRRKTVQRGGIFGRFLPTGHLVYLHNGTLFAAPFALDRLEVRGTPAPVLEEVAYESRSGSAQFDFSPAGMLVYRSGGAGASQVTVQWLDGDGKALPLVAKPGDYATPRVSPDGSRLALALKGDIWIYELQRDTVTRLSQGIAANYPVWTPDGRYIVFRATGGMFWTRSDGSGRPQSLTQSKNLQIPGAFAPDGKRLAFAELNSEGLYSIWTVPVEGGAAGLRAGKPEIFLQASYDSMIPSFSSDGRWLAYTSTESGTREVYVQAYPDRGGKWQISNGGGMIPLFSRRGGELFFRTLDNQIMVASYSVKGDSFVAEKPRLWSGKRLANIGLSGNYDLAPDGKRIVGFMRAETPEAQKAQNHVVFLLNFFDYLRQRVPTGGQ